ncbi:hypothetical protein EC915_101526 [Pseudomonas sp. LP_7_YM]|nr:hypothetical protein EC915_101526 [Pseudomonas sp. LP_7_YM]
MHFQRLPKALVSTLTPAAQPMWIAKGATLTAALLRGLLHALLRVPFTG